MLFYYAFLAAFAVLMFYIFYQHVCSMAWDDNEVRHLERMELNVANIVRLLEAPDVKFLLNQPTSRENLFMEFSTALKSDVVSVCRWRGMRMGSLGLLAVFFFSYYALRIKAHLACSRRDLQFLSGLEMAFVRSMSS
jgi:hypothetical protein